MAPAPSDPRGAAAPDAGPEERRRATGAVDHPEPDHGRAFGSVPPLPEDVDAELGEDFVDEEWLERERRDHEAARASLYARLRRGPLLSAVGRADRWGSRLVRRQARSRRLTRQIRRFSLTGEHGIAWLVLGGSGALVDAGHRGPWLRATATVGGTYLLNTAIKQVARRPRPDHPELPALVGTPGSMSFPSSHAASSFAAAAAFRHRLPTAPLYLGATAMAVSRVHLGVHYPSDIVVGATVGTIVGRLAGPPPR